MGSLRSQPQLKLLLWLLQSQARLKKYFDLQFDGQKNPEKFTLIVTEKRKDYQGHSPNIIGITQAFQAIHQFFKKYNSHPEVLIHDSQDEYGSELRRYYEYFGHMLIEERDDGGFPLAEIAPYAKGQFTIMQSSKNFGLQAVDLLLWICQREVCTENMRELNRIIEENLDRFFISRDMSQGIVNHHLLKRVSK